LTVFVLKRPNESVDQEVYKLLYGSGLSVDVIVETPERFLELKDNPYLIYQQIETKGRLLYDKQRYR